MNRIAIDALLAASLRGEDVTALQRPAAAGDAAAIFARITYHGVAGLLQGTRARSAWAATLARQISDEAVGQAMWELRHRQLLNDVLSGLAAANLVAILLKGTALAYDLYAVAATRSRGDSDLLLDPADLAAARGVLSGLGFACLSGQGNAFSLQEVWNRRCDLGLDHDVDLHWQVLNSPALDGVLPVAECLAERVALPRLGPHAMAMDRVRTLIHTCLHRRLNFASPYFVGDQTYYGGDRLIWLKDLDLLARTLSAAEWRDFVRLAADRGVAAACLDGLRTAQRVLATPFPRAVSDALEAPAAKSRPAVYLGARQLGRAWLDLRAIAGVKRKWRYLRARALPSAQFVRDKYPRQAGLPLPLPLLHARRMIDLFRDRPTQGTGR